MWILILYMTFSEVHSFLFHIIIHTLGYDIKVEESEEEEEGNGVVDEQMNNLLAQVEEEVNENGNNHLFDDEEVDYEVLNNLLTSLSMQDGVDGPVNSIMTSLGIRLPPGGGSN